jgi:hypothetical protein
VISPLLANIALHGLETAIRSRFPKTLRRDGKVIDNWKPFVVRYADDFVVLHQDGVVIEQVKQIASEWLAQLGLELKPSKTSITHTLDAYEGKVGFDLPSLPCATVPRRQNAHGQVRRSQLIPTWVQNLHHPQQSGFASPS